MHLFHPATIIVLLFFWKKDPASVSSVSIASAERINIPVGRTLQGRHRKLKRVKDSSDEEFSKRSTRSSTPLPSLSSSYSKKSNSGKGNSKGSKKGTSKSKSSSSNGMPGVPSQVTLDITDYFIAYSVPGLLQEPTSTEVELLQKQTKQYWTEFFQEYFAINSTSDYTYDEQVKFSGIHLKVADTKFGQDNPPEYLDFYVEYDMKLLYELGSGNPPDVAQTFDIMRYQSDIYTRYVTDFVTSIPSFSQTEFIFFEAIDPITLPPIPTPPPGSILEVQAPEFIFAYNIPGLTEPNSFQLQQLVERTRNFLFDDTSYRLPPGYYLYEIKLSSTSAVFDAGNPGASYNYYVTFEAVFVVSKDTWVDDPALTPEDIFISITTSDFASYVLSYVRTIPGFETTKGIALERNDPPHTFKETLPAHYMAYGVPGMTAEPSSVELQQLADKTQSFWNAFFEEYFAASDVVFLEVKLSPVQAFYNAKIPEQQFNYWVGFDVTVIVDGQGTEPPLPFELFQIMSNADFVPYILDYVRSIPVFQTTDEIDFRELKGLVTEDIVELEELFIAYKIEDLTVEPSFQEVDELVALTRQFLHRHLIQQFEDFGVEGYVNIELTLLSAGTNDVPEPEIYNYVIRFNVAMNFAPGYPPFDRRTAFEILAFYADLEKYRREYVLSIEAFAFTEYLYLDQVKDRFEIHVPRFGLSYDIPGLTEPTSFQLEQLVETTSSFLLDTGFRLPDGYFVTEVKLDFTETGTPDDTSFDYYVTYEAVFLVSKEDWAEDPVPTSDDILELISTADFVSYILYYARNIEGFETTKKVGFKSIAPPLTFNEKLPAHYMAYGVPGMTAEPSSVELQQLADKTQSFWNAFYEEYFAASDVVFLEVKLSPVQAFYNAKIPEQQFNYWVGFDVTVIVDGQGTEPPLPFELFQIMSNADFVPYILDYVRSIPVFQTTDEIDFRELKGLVTKDIVELEELFIAFNIVDLFVEPSADAVDQLVDGTRQFFHSHLVQHFPDIGVEGYMNTELMLIEAGTSNVPDPDFYNYMIRFSVTMSFAPGFQTPDMRTAFEALAFYVDLEQYRRKYVAPIDAFALTQYLYLDWVMMGDSATVKLDGLFFALTIPELMSGPREDEVFQLMDHLRLFWDEQLYNFFGDDFLNADLSLVEWGLETDDVFVIDFDMIIGFVPGTPFSIPDPAQMFFYLSNLAGPPTLLPSYITTVPTFQNAIEASFYSRDPPTFVKKDTEVAVAFDETIAPPPPPPPPPTESSKMLSLEELLQKSSATTTITNTTTILRGEN